VYSGFSRNKNTVAKSLICINNLYTGVFINSNNHPGNDNLKNFFVESGGNLVYIDSVVQNKG
jgi:hypothetical protein